MGSCTHVGNINIINGCGYIHPNIIKYCGCIMILLEYTEDGFVGFNHGGEFITDPFFDETNKKTVNPFTYYGISKNDLSVMIKENQLTVRRIK